MRRLIVFNQVTLDGFFADAKGDMRWAHKSDPEWNDFVGSKLGPQSDPEWNESVGSNPRECTAVMV